MGKYLSNIKTCQAVLLGAILAPTDPLYGTSMKPMMEYFWQRDKQLST
jgi:NhaP-type Na+/H+ or K+/H+ antiporter